MRYQCASSALIAIAAWVLCSARSLRAALQTAHPQFHCGTPPPAAAPRTTTRSMIRLLEIPTFPRWTPAQPRSRGQDRVTPGGPPQLEREASRPLLAGGARIHVDFHANRHFDDLRCLPGHYGSPCSPDELRPRELN